MTATTWYWINGTTYCPACVECDTPAVDAADCTRGPSGGIRCACCHTTDADNVVFCSVTREGNTWYVFSDDGEMLAAGPGRVSTIEDLMLTLRSRGVSRASVDGLFVDVPEAAS